jgi:hypothetical protein
MRQLASRIKPASGFPYVIHLLLTAVLPLAVYVLVRIHFVQLAVALVLLSKWRMLAVKARHWPANIRSNAVDITVGLSFVAFMAKSSSPSLQILWAFFFTIWLLFLKPQTTTFWVAGQAMVAQFVGLMSIYLVWPKASPSQVAALVGLVCYFCGRHYFTSFNESYARTGAYVWAYVAAALAWVSGHWLIYYGVISQTVLLLTIVSYGLGALYYLDYSEKLTPLIRKQFVLTVVAGVVLILVFSDWSDKAF